MNHSELVMELARRTGISASDCDNLLKSLEQIMTEEFSEKKWKSRTFDFVLGVMNSIKNVKERSQSSRTK